MAKAPTPYMAFMLPVPGSKEPFRVADVNEWFQTIDTKFQTSDGVQTSLNGRLNAIEPFLLPGFAEPSAKFGLTPAGTTAERDAFWGTPAAGQARIDLANRFARWFNTEKGWIEQYFCAWDEVGTGKLAGTPQKKVARWGPSMSEGRVPIQNFTATGATAANVKKYGHTVEIIGTTNDVSLDGVFTSDFDEYEINFEVWNASAAGDVNFRLRGAGVDDSTNTYKWARLWAGVSAPANENGTIQSTGRIGLMHNTSGAHNIIRITNPATADWKRYWSNSTMEGQSQFTGGIVNQNFVRDGIRFFPAGGGSFAAGYLRVYGVSNGR